MNGSIHTAVLTFSPHPMSFFDGGRQVTLYSDEQKSRMLGELGVDYHFDLPFDQMIAEMEPEDFVKHFLCGLVNCAHLSVGDDFRFGARRRGDVSLLQDMGRVLGFKVHVIERLRQGDAPISSSRIRTLLTESGDVQGATELLGRPFCLEGVVVHGKKVGRTIGCPTANIGDIFQIMPLIGVYGGYASFRESSESPAKLLTIDSNSLPVVINIGVRPTVENSFALKVEAHVIEGRIGNDELYGKLATLRLIMRVRDELKFSGLEALRSAIHEDIARVKSSLAEMQIV
jgi:riboflavin kinase / FMN adenylyltransferase